MVSMGETELEIEALALLLTQLDRDIIPFHEKKLTHDPRTIRKWKQELEDSVCFYHDNKKCSIRCRWFSFCDECDKPFCNLRFEDPVDGQAVRLCHVTFETLCKECHDYGCGCYEKEDS